MRNMEAKLKSKQEPPPATPPADSPPGNDEKLEVIGAIIMRKDSASVAMQHEIRETLEGNNINLSGNLNQTVMPADRLAAFRDLKSQADETIAEQEEPDVDSPTE